MNSQDTISGILAIEHRKIDEQFERFGESVAAGQPAPQFFQEAVASLYRHIEIEERFLLPEIEAAGLVGPASVMRYEHEEIRRLTADVQVLLGKQAECVIVQSLLHGLLVFLREHNYKEEHVLYPAADRLLGGNSLARAEIRQQMRNT